MLVSEIIERTYNEYLYPSGANRPSYDKLSGAIDASTLTIPFSGRVQQVPDDTVYEIDSELILGESFNVNTNVGTARERGWLQTGAATHATGATVWIDPTFPRKAIFDGLISIMGLLYPAGVYARKVDSSTAFSWSEPTKDLPTGGKKLISIDVKSVGTVVRWNPLRPGIDYREMVQFSPPKYELYRGGAEGAVMQVVYKADFTVPTAESDNLSSLLNPVPDTLQPYLPMGIAGHLLQSQDIPKVQIEEIRRALASAGQQPAVATQLGQGMLNNFMGRYVAAERDRLKETDAMGLEFVRR